LPHNHALISNFSELFLNKSIDISKKSMTKDHKLASTPYNAVTIPSQATNNNSKITKHEAKGRHKGNDLDEEVHRDEQAEVKPEVTIMHVSNDGAECSR
jgi:hypothetical protein